MPPTKDSRDQSETQVAVAMDPDSLSVVDSIVLVSDIEMENDRQPGKTSGRNPVLTEDSSGYISSGEAWTGPNTCLEKQWQIYISKASAFKSRLVAVDLFFAGVTYRLSCVGKNW